MTTKSIYTGKIRVRACGLLVKDDSILLLKHIGLGDGGFLWSPPGGGVAFGATAEETVVREFREEANIEVRIKEYLFTNEYIDPHHHAIELFFSVIKTGGEEKLGTDPEASEDEQILTEIKYLKFDEIEYLNKINVHNAFRFCDHASHITSLRGFFKFHNI